MDAQGSLSGWEMDWQGTRELQQRQIKRPGPETGSWLVRKESGWTQVERERAVCTCRKTANHIPGCITKKCSHQVEESDYDDTPLFSICTGLLCLVWDFPSTRHQHAGESSLEGNWNVEWAGAHGVRAEAERAGFVLCWDEKAGEMGGIFMAAFSFLMSKYKEGGAKLFLQLNNEEMR